jgi:hypothetical protein
MKTLELLTIFLCFLFPFSGSTGEQALRAVENPRPSAEVAEQSAPALKFDPIREGESPSLSVLKEVTRIFKRLSITGRR